MTPDPNLQASVRAARIANYRRTLQGALTTKDRDYYRNKLDSLLRAQACGAPLDNEELNYAQASGHLPTDAAIERTAREAPPQPGLNPRA